MNQKTILFYDLETTGRSPEFDQIVQFAAIRTDTDLKELERYNIYIQLNPEVIPDPRAMLTHRISLSDLHNADNEYRAALRIYQIVNTPNTINIGYNNLNFDDEFLRFLFFRNLLPPFTHQFAQNCQRADLLPITIVYYLFNPLTINWPHIEGQPSFKLARLQAENQLSSGPAHDALTDVEVSVNLARHFLQKPDMWQYLLNEFHKPYQNQRANKLPIAFEPNHYQGVLVDISCGGDSLFHWPVLALGQHYHYQNQTVWLRLDKQDLAEVTDVSECQTFHRKSSGVILPFKPRFVKHLTHSRQQMRQHNLQILHNNPALWQRLQQHYQDFTYTEYEGVDPDAALYTAGLATPDQKAWCQRFHQLEPADKLDWLQHVTDPVLYNRAVRVLARHFANSLPTELVQSFQNYVNQLYTKSEHEGTPAVINHKGQPRRTAAEALTILTDLETEQHDRQGQQIIDELKRLLRAGE